MRPWCLYLWNEILGNFIELFIFQGLVTYWFSYAVCHNDAREWGGGGGIINDVLKFRKIIKFPSSWIAMNCQGIYNVLQKQWMIISVGDFSLKLSFLLQKTILKVSLIQIFYQCRLSWSSEIDRFRKIVIFHTNWIIPISLYFRSKIMGSGH